MAIIYSYPTVIPTANDLVLGTDVDQVDKPTKNFTVQSIIDLVTVSGNDLQAVLNNGNTATQNIILTGNISATAFTDGTMSISAGSGTGFVSITSTDFVGDITGVVKAGSSIQSSVTGVTQNQGDNSTKLATTAYVDSKVDPSVLQYLGDSTGPFDLNLVNDDFKITGTANQIETTATAVAGNVGIINLKFPTAGVVLPDGSTATTQAITDNTTKVATTAFVHSHSAAQDLDFTTGSGSGSVLLDSQTLTLAGTANQITTSGSGQTATFALTSDVTISGIYTGATFAGDLLGTVNTATTGTTQNAGDNSTKIATTAYVDNAAGSKTLDYAGDATGPFSLNLSTDDLEFNGDSNITVTAAAVAVNKGIVTIDLDNDVTITGTMQAGTLSDGTFSGTAGTYTGGVSITSTTFVGALTGNASSATQLASSGAIALTGDTTSTGGPYTYTSGGALNIATTIADTTVTGKVLTNLPTPTSASIAATDTILAAMAKLQGQITSTTGLAYEGTWDPGNSATSGGTPDLRQASAKVNGHFYICSGDGVGTPNGDGTTPNSWKTGDWVIYVANGSATDEWQKLDQSNEVLGSGTANKIAKWTATNTLGTGLIEDNGTTVTIGNSGNLSVQGNTTLGDADADTTLIKGPGTADKNFIIHEGLGVGTTPTYGSAGQILSSGGGVNAANVWIDNQQGTVTSVGASIDGDCLNIAGSPVTSSGTLAFTFQGDNTQYIDGAGDLTTFPTKDNYQYWTLSDGTNTSNILTTNTATFTGGTYITTGESSKTLTITHDATSRSDTTSTDAPAFAGTFDAVTSVTSNATGHVTAIDVSTVTIPANPVFVGPSGSGSAQGGTAGIVPAPSHTTYNGGYFLRQDATWAIPPDSQGVTSVTATAPISSSGGTTPNITHDNSGVTAGTYQDVTVDAKGHVTAGSNPAGGAGIHSFSDTVNASSNEDIFEISCNHGAQTFTAYFTCNTTGVSVAKTYTVAHSYGGTVVYNKLVDTGPYSATAANDFTVTFTGATDKITCNIANLNTTTNLDIVTTIMLGGSPTTLTVTAL